MKRRLLAAVAALVLATLGALVLLSYVRGADARALAGVQSVQVLVVIAAVPAGTTVEDLDALVELDLVPAKAAAAGGLNSLTGHAGEVTTTDLLPGEQLLASRLADPATLIDGGAVPIPDGMQQLTVSLEPQRALGGHLIAGDTVGIFLTVEDGTHLSLHNVLVTRAQGAASTAPVQDPDAADDGQPAETPSTNLLVTFAVLAPDAERIVWGMEHATLWLSLEPQDARQDGTRVVTSAEAFQ